MRVLSESETQSTSGGCFILGAVFRWVFGGGCCCGWGGGSGGSKPQKPNIPTEPEPPATL